MLLWKQAITYKPGLPLSFIDEETLILSSFFCTVEISCPPKDIKMRWINVCCHFDRPNSLVSLHICSRRENYQILLPITMNKRESRIGIGGQPASQPACQGLMETQLPCCNGCYCPTGGARQQLTPARLRSPCWLPDCNSQTCQWGSHAASPPSKVLWAIFILVFSEPASYFEATLSVG